MRGHFSHHLAAAAVNLFHSRQSSASKGSNAAIVAALMGGKPDQAIAQGAVHAEGRVAVLSELLSLTTASEFWFPIVTHPAWKP